MRYILRNHVSIFSLWILILLYYNIIESCGADEVLYYEDHKKFKGQKFCDRQDSEAANFFAKMCIKLAIKDQILNYNEDKLRQNATACQNGTLFLLSKKDGQWKQVPEKILRCQFIIGRDPNPIVKGFGRGEEQNDAMLYVPNNWGLWDPDSTRPGYLLDV